MEGIIPAMRITTGRVVRGKIEIEDALLDEGALVTVAVPDGDQGDELTMEDEDELLAAIADVDRGEFILGDELLKDLRRSGD
jgi:hypothetical protein